VGPGGGKEEEYGVEGRLLQGGVLGGGFGGGRGGGFESIFASLSLPRNLCQKKKRRGASSMHKETKAPVKKEATQSGIVGSGAAAHPKEEAQTSTNEEGGKDGALARGFKNYLVPFAVRARAASGGEREGAPRGCAVNKKWGGRR